MDNFDYKKFLAEGKLYEAMAPQDVVDIADTVAEEFTKESAEAGEFLVYSVGRMEADDMSFELDTDLTSQSPKDIDTRGVGEGWGGIFRIKPTEDGYEVRNAEKGGLVAMIDNAGNFRMLSADESRAEMGMEEGPVYPEDKHLMTPDEFGDDELDMDRYNDELDMDRYNDELDMKRMEEAEEAPKSNKMKKSELKEMIKAAMLAEAEINENADMISAEKLFALIARDLQFSPLVQDGVMLSKEDAIEIMRHVIAIEQSDISPEAALGEYIASGDLNEAKDEEVADEIELEDTEEVDVEMDADMGGGSEVDGIDVKQDADAELGGVKGDVQDNLEAALEAAKKLGDDKLVDQIGNSLTFFTRQHVVKEGDMIEDEAEMGLEEAKENLNESIEFPMWNKIK